MSVTATLYKREQKAELTVQHKRKKKKVILMAVPNYIKKI